MRRWWTRLGGRYWLVAASLIISVACWFDTPSWLRGTARRGTTWQWRYYEPRRPVAVAATLLVFTGLALALDRKKQHRAAAAALLPAALLLQLEVVGLTRSPAAHVWPPIIHDIIGRGDIQAIREHGLGELFRDWESTRTQLPRPHLPIRPPFALLPAALSWHACQAFPQMAATIARLSATWRTTDSPDESAAALLTGLMSLTMAALTPLLSTVLLRRRNDPTPIASAAFCFMLPALLTHIPTFDQLHVPFFMACAVASFLGPPALGALLAGVCAAAVAEISFVSLVVGNVGAALVWLRARALDYRPRRAATAVLAVAAGAVLTFAAAWAATGFSWPDGLRTVMAEGHPEVLMGRPYWASFYRNPVDVLVWCGPLPTIGFVAGAAGALRRLIRGERSIDALPLAVAFALAVLQLSGAVRCEAGRIWMPWFPLIAVSALPILRQALPGRWLWVGGAAQIVHTWVLLARWGS
jgi:hypothetical protein